MMLPITAIACLAIGLLGGYGIATRIPREASVRKDEKSERTVLETPSSGVLPRRRPPAKTAPAPAEKLELQSDPAVEEMKVVLLGLLNTLNTAVAHLQEGSDQYELELDTHREALREQLTMTDLKRLGADLVHQVETMYTVNTEYRKQIEDANAIVQKQKEDLETLQLRTGKDFLTELWNRHAYSDRIKEMINISRRYGNIFTLMVIDIDHFKLVNDTHGHLAGDTVLKEVAKLLAGGSRSSDFLARYGGEEFVYLLPETDTGPALEMGDLLRRRIEKAVISFDGTKIPVTISTGVDTVKSGGDTPEDLFKRADAALYRAKENGRNRVEGPEDSES